MDWRTVTIVSLERVPICVCFVLSKRRVAHTSALVAPENYAASVHSYHIVISVTIQVDTEADLPLIFGDPVSLRAMLMMLIGNAIDALPMGGRITVSAHSEPAMPVGAPHSLEHIHIAVEDDGEGEEPKEAIVEEVKKPRYFPPKRLPNPFESAA